MATVSKDLRNNHVSVRVHEKFTQFQVNQFHMGTRKSSKDDKKILVGKCSAGGKKGNCDNTLLKKIHFNC
ncbi:hypothetical protein HN51_044366 [Arachis hypogaea]